MAAAADHARIAIALCALRFKPAGQSHAAYVLDLRAKFPPSRPATGVGSWREHALALEGELAALQAEHERAQIRLFALSASAPAPAPAPKKKARKKPSDTPAPASTDLDAALDSSDYASIVAIPGQGSPFLAFEAFTLLEQALDDHKQVPASLVLSTATRALEAAGAILRSVLPPAHSQASSGKVLRAISALLTHLLAVVLPILMITRRGTAPAQDPLGDQLLGAYAASIGLPLVRAFGPCCDGYVRGVFGAGPKIADVRGDVLGVFRTGLAAFDGFGGHAGVESLRETLGEAAARELEKLYGEDQGDRVRALGRKDALWFLCNVLHLVAGGGGSKRTADAPSRAAQCRGRERLLDTLSELLRRSRGDHRERAAGAVEGSECGGRQGASRARVDEAERAMLLAVVEGVWDNQGPCA